MSVFENKIAIVTGGASGIGRALARDLAARGAQVMLADLQVDAALGVAAEITASGGKAAAHYLDVSDSESVERLVARTVAEKGRLDYMFNNAGIAIIGEFRDLPAADWKRILDINVNGVFAGTAAAYAVMVRQGAGHIVNTASLAGLVPSPGLAAYCASKHAVVGLSTSLRAEAAAYGVKVSAVCPGFIRTPILDSPAVGMRKERKSKERAERMAMAPEECAARVLEGVAKNKAVIAVTAHAKVFWVMSRYFPGLMHAANLRMAGQLHRERVEEGRT
jgi:NAD(P)-dependent dehydrogenase (short-subunit alcohol dehydrogenase family)